jgi:hypothetical protein
MSGSIIFITSCLMKRKRSIYLYPAGNTRIEPIGVVIFASAMFVATFQVFFFVLLELVFDFCCFWLDYCGGYSKNHFSFFGNPRCGCSARLVDDWNCFGHHRDKVSHVALLHRISLQIEFCACSRDRSYQVSVFVFIICCIAKFVEKVM